MPIVKHITGPLAGKETSVDAKKNQVTFGRSVECDVVFPVDAIDVGRKHFALVRKPNGRWAFDLFGDFVAVDGEPADPGALLPRGATIELGHLGGPSFRFEAEAATDNLPDTGQQQPDPGARRIAAQAGASAGWARRIAIAAGVVAALAAGIGFYAYSQVSPLEQAFRDHDAQLAKLAQESIGVDVRKRVQNAAFLVVAADADGNLSGLASAWPVAKHILATNAHVAEVKDQLRKGLTMAVRAPGKDGAIYKVVKQEMHPGYKAFEQYAGRDAIFVPTATGLTAIRVGYATYDAALLYVEEDLPDDTILTVASDDELRALASGDPVMLAGYPQDNVDNSETLVLGALPTLQIGNVTSITDYFYLPADFEQARFINHNLPASGGASGSAIVNAKGHVVALHNLGAFSAALINTGQRADLVRSLLEHRADAEVARDRPYWDKQLAHFKVGAEDIVAELIAKDKPDANATAKQEKAWNGKLAERNRFQVTNKNTNETSTLRRVSQPLALKAGVQYTFVVYRTTWTPVTLSLKVGGSIVAEDSGRSPIISYPGKGKRLQSNADAQLIVTTADEDTWYVLRSYVWQSPGS